MDASRMKDQPTSKFEELRDEARATVEKEKFDKDTRTIIYMTVAILFVYTCLIFLFLHLFQIGATVGLLIYFKEVLAGALFLALASLLLAFFPFNEKWNRRKRFNRIFQILFLVFVSISPALFFHYTI